MTELTTASFDAFIREGKVVIDFGATWCGPCRTMKPTLVNVAKALGIKLGLVDVDQCEQLAHNYHVTALPTLMMFKDGRHLKSHTGAMTELQLRQWLKS